MKLRKKSDVISSAPLVNEITFTSPLNLKSDPIDAKEVATKRFVDSSFGALNAENILDGVISESTLPAFSGDTSNSKGTSEFTLPYTGVTEGVSTKTTTDSKGRVINREGLSETDIPELTWSKVNRNKPNTLTGYGIENGLKNDGGQVGSGFGIDATPTDPLHVVNRALLETELETVNTPIPVGKVLGTSSSHTPEGFLRCNGGVVNKADYTELYEIIGEKFRNNFDIGIGEFMLPDFSTEESGNLSYYIKY